MADGSLPERWYAAADLAGLPGLPSTERRILSTSVRAGWERRQRTHGKGWEYAFASLPPETQAALLLRECPHRSAPSDAHVASAWQRYEQAKQPMKDMAAQRLKALHAVHALVRAGTPLMQARDIVAAQLQRDNVPRASSASLGRWQKTVSRAHRADWLALLLPHYTGRTATAECHPEDYAQLAALYLSPRANSFIVCYRRVARTAEAAGRQLPCARTLKRRIEKEFARQEIVFARHGEEGLAKIMPSMVRTRSNYQAMEAINGDGVLFVPWVVFPTGELARPKVWVWQCLGTGKILAWRGDASENREMLRLAFGDLVEKWGLPQKVFLDNTMAAANLQMTGGARNRFRYFGRRIKQESIVGIMPMCGVEVRFVKPAHGQSKPIERAFRDLRELIDHHPKYGTRGTKKNPLPYAEWLAIFEAEIAAHNAQTGRRGSNFAGRSFDQVFAESYAHATVRKATAEQRRLWLLAADQITVNRENPTVSLGRSSEGENRYTSNALYQWMGRKVVVRFDPQAMHGDVHVYALDGTYICAAECLHRGGFETEDHGRAWGREQTRFKKATKDALHAKQRMDELTAAERVPDVEPPTAPAPGVTAVDFRARPRPVAAPLAATGTEGPSKADLYYIRMSEKLKGEQL